MPPSKTTASFNGELGSLPSAHNLCASGEGLAPAEIKNPDKSSSTAIAQVTGSPVAVRSTSFKGAARTGVPPAVATNPGQSFGQNLRVAVDSSTKVSSTEVGPVHHDDEKPPLLTLTPPQIYKATVKYAVHKAHAPFLKTFVLSVYAGFYISLGGMLLTVVGGGSPTLAANNPGLQKFVVGAIGLPFGLFLVVLTGSELFTSNCMYMMAGWYENAVTTLDVLRSLSISYIGNFVGSLAIVYAGKAIDVLSAPSMVAYAVSVANLKTSHNFGITFLKGILCNWMVCAAIWQGIAATSGASKFIGIFLPVSAFVAMGFEHCIANQYLIPQGMVQGAPVSVGQLIVKNQIPAVLGNIWGGGVMVAGLAFFAFSPKKSEWVAMAQSWASQYVGHWRRGESVRRMMP